MNNDNVQSLRRLSSIVPILGFVAIAGCASGPDEREVVTEPVVKSAPMDEEQAPVPMTTLPSAPPARSGPVVLAVNHPERYVVVKGDTLWDISGRFLRDPWLWPEVWQGNPQVANPHLIFPGDILMITMIDGRPVMQVERGPLASAAGVTDGMIVQSRVPVDDSGRPLKVVKLRPQVREIDLEKAIPTIPMDVIRQFLESSVVADGGELDDAAYVVSFPDEHIAAGTGYRAYVRGIDDEDIAKYMVVRPGKDYIDPDSGENLGKEALYLAGAQMERGGDPATVELVNAKREVLRTDRLIPGEPEKFNYNFMPHSPAKKINGRVISVFDAVNQIGQYQVVALNLGKREGMEPGHVLAVYQDGQEVVDPVRGGLVKMPDERAGTVIVFRIFDKVSYGLVTNSIRAIHIKDRVKNP